MADVLTMTSTLTLTTREFVQGLTEATRQVSRFVADTAHAVADASAKIAAGAGAISAGITASLGLAAKTATECHMAPVG